MSYPLGPHDLPESHRAHACRYLYTCSGGLLMWLTGHNQAPSCDGVSPNTTALTTTVLSKLPERWLLATALTLVLGLPAIVRSERIVAPRETLWSECSSQREVTQQGQASQPAGQAGLRRQYQSPL